MAARIHDRIDYALELVAERGMEVRAIYLDETDDADFVKAATRYWRKKLKSKAQFWPTEYRGHPVRPGRSSVIYSTHGVGVTVPKRLKVAA